MSRWATSCTLVEKLLVEKLLDAGNLVLYGAHKPPPPRGLTNPSSSGGDMHPAWMPAWPAGKRSVWVLCVLAGAFGRLVAAGSFTSRGTLSLRSPVASLSQSGLAFTVVS